MCRDGRDWGLYINIIVEVVNCIIVIISYCAFESMIHFRNRVIYTQLVLSYIFFSKIGIYFLKLRN